MKNIRAACWRFWGLFQKKQRDAEITEEIQQHIDEATERKMAAGMSPTEARRATLREFGGIEQWKELAREERAWLWPDQLRQDVRFAFRTFHRNPAFFFLAVLCLTLGIGANAAVFSWSNGILFHPYPAVVHEERMFTLVGTTHGASGPNQLSYSDCLDLQDQSTLIESIIVDQLIATTLSIGDRAERAVGDLVTPNYFEALGVQPFMGRGFTPEEGEGRNAHPVAVISYETWKNRYQSDPAILGKTQSLNGVQHTIVGVAPENFHGTFVGVSFQFWAPISMQETFDPTGYKLEDRGARAFESFVFLKPGVTLRQAQEEFSAIAQRLENAYPKTNRGHGFTILPLWRSPFNVAAELLPTLQIAFAVVLLVLFIACANVGTLLLVRSLLRQHEITARLALGASRRRIVQQLLTEGLLLSAFATVGGIIIAHWCRNALVLAFPAQAPGIIVNLPGQIDWRVLSVSIGVCVLAAILFALAPAIQATKVNLAAAINSGASGVVGSHARSRLRSAFVLIQISLSFVLIAGAGLLMQSLRQIQSTPPGFATDDVLLSGVDLLSAGYNAERAKAFQDQLLDRVRALPGVEGAAFARVIPFGLRDFSSAPVAVEGYSAQPEERPLADYNQVDPEYFAVMRIPITAGRLFTRDDNESRPLVAIVDETMAAKYWPERNPIGARLQVKDQWLEVVGIAKASHYRSKLETPKPFFYVPLRQNFAVQGGLLIQTNQTPGTITPALARAVHSLDPNLAPVAPIPMQEHVHRGTYTQRLAVTLLGMFGGMALLLAAIGLYAVMSYTVSQSTRELALRMALGARVADLLRLVISRGVVLTTGGVSIGLAAALVITRQFQHRFYHVDPHDPLAFGCAILLLMTVALVSCLVPACRAARINPARALRA